MYTTPPSYPFLEFIFLIAHGSDLRSALWIKVISTACMIDQADLSTTHLLNIKLARLMLGVM